jgi:predicted metalloprotease with PDZ domain
MSQQAPWRDGAAVLDQANVQNVFISYYTYGAAVALALDLTLRGNYPGKDLDGYMRDLWQHHGKPAVYYTVPDLERALARYSGDAAFAADFFSRYVRGNELPDYAPLLAKAGLVLRRASAGAAYIGNDRFTYDARGGATLSIGTTAGTPLYEAGLDRGDRIISIDGRPFSADSVIAGVRAAHRPGDIVAIEYESRGRRMNGRVTLGEDPRMEVAPMDAVTPEMLAFRRAWLGTDH